VFSVRDALIAKAEFFANIGDTAAATTAYEVALAKTVGAGPRIDVVFAVMRVALFATDVPLLKKKLDEAHKYVLHRGMLFFFFFILLLLLLLLFFFVAASSCMRCAACLLDGPLLSIN
jgi:hypothetical protein